MKVLTLFVQILFFILIFFVGQQISQALNLPIPGSIVGFGLLFLLLHLKVIKLNWVERAGNLLVGELLLFFIPAVVGLINYGDVLKSFGLQILIVITISTIVVMAITGMMAESISKRKEVSNE
ncbi:CidA/LrgA family protein [Priestia flexa]|uniref:CidA/LrgA family protein n=2 Tax=Bacillaceae TaxID=186817 RepID=A0ABU4J2P5_9BACI|nr:CidA/LrgA family protein [Priestia flexa]AQX55395.1 murein hydrolase regulator LrgA [Priestia flexa]MCA1201581.1 CidA/LrgA family protein [Priestia flexa]MCG7312976.1 CidA/LrgA family protein [Priestia flexa]MDW8515264.1 CidA/LrgA family protein [Priestia flexa]MED4589088.1 CidA/LrgA family protein [Priestia flexa]